MNVRRTTRHEREKTQKIELLKEYLSNIFELKDTYTQEYLREIKEIDNERNRTLTSQHNEHEFLLRTLNNQFKNTKTSSDNTKTNSEDEDKLE